MPSRSQDLREAGKMFLTGLRDLIQSALDSPSHVVILSGFAVSWFLTRRAIFVVTAGAVVSIIFTSEPVRKLVGLAPAASHETETEEVEDEQAPSLEVAGPAQGDDVVTEVACNEDRSLETQEPIFLFRSAEELNNSIQRQTFPETSADRKLQKAQMDVLLRCFNIVEGPPAKAPPATPLRMKLQRKLNSKQKRSTDASDDSGKNPQAEETEAKDPLEDNAKLEQLLRELGEDPKKEKKTSRRKQEKDKKTPSKGANEVANSSDAVEEVPVEEEAPAEEEEEEEEDATVEEDVPAEEEALGDEKVSEEDADAGEEGADSAESCEKSTMAPTAHGDVQELHSSEWSVVTKNVKSKKRRPLERPVLESDSPSSASKKDGQGATEQQSDDEGAEDWGDWGGDDDEAHPNTADMRCPEGRPLESFLCGNSMSCGSCGKKYPKGTEFWWSGSPDWAACEACIRGTGNEEPDDEESELLAAPSRIRVNVVDTPSKGAETPSKAKASTPCRKDVEKKVDISATVSTAYEKMNSEEIAEWFKSRNAESVLREAMKQVLLLEAEEKERSKGKKAKTK